MTVLSTIASRDLVTDTKQTVADASTPKRDPSFGLRRLVRVPHEALHWGMHLWCRDLQQAAEVEQLAAQGFGWQRDMEDFGERCGAIVSPGWVVRLIQSVRWTIGLDRFGGVEKAAGKDRALVWDSERVGNRSEKRAIQWARLNCTTPTPSWTELTRGMGAARIWHCRGLAGRDVIACRSQVA